MLSETDKQLLLRNLNLNQVVLVTGAGFSVNCKNMFGQHLPTSRELAKELWSFMYTEPYDGTSQLKTLYGAATRKPGGKLALRAFLRKHLYAVEIPDWYKLVTGWHWYRIYSFNADDVMEQVYGDKRLSRIVAPSAFQERDQFLHTIQYIKLHGSLDEGRDLTFGVQEYGARAASKSDLWYQHFVEDYSTSSVVFVGTELDEQLFWQHLEARGAQIVDGETVRRPKCLLVKPTISQPKEDQLEQYRIVPVRSTAQDFFQWLNAQQKPLSREDVLRQSHPDWEPALRASEERKPARQVAALEAFLSIFHSVKRPASSRNSRLSNAFLLGSAPTWEDIANDLDADREVNHDFRTLLDEAVRNRAFDIIRVSSAAGGGKSTVLKRAALSLVDDGYKVYFSDASQRPIPSVIADYAFSVEERSFYFFDNAGPDLSEISECWAKVSGRESRPIFVVAARSNDFSYCDQEFERRGARVADLYVPDLTDSDISAIIATLELHGLLGKLQEKTTADRIQMFKGASRHQILVAMREATRGYGFDEILKDEFAKLNTDDARLLYLIAAVASDDNFGLSKKFMIAAMADVPSRTQALIDQSLKGILLPSANNDADSTYSIRHPAIAHFIIESASREQLAEALIALMTALAGVLPAGKAKKASRPFRLYKRLLNHTYIQGAFPGRRLARSIYQSIMPYFREDGHFWLQYASYEIEGGGDISLADNYLSQAEAILGEGSRQVQTAKAHLLFLKALQSPNAAVAKEFADEAVKILRDHMLESDYVSWHALHIFGDQMHAYIWKWIPTVERSSHFASAHEELRRAIPEKMSSHRLLQSTLKTLKRSQLETLVRPR